MNAIYRDMLFRTCFSSCFSLLFLYCLIDSVCLSVVVLPLPSLPPFLVAAAGECCRAECRVQSAAVCVCKRCTIKSKEKDNEEENKAT